MASDLLKFGYTIQQLILIMLTVISSKYLTFIDLNVPDPA